MNKLNIFEEIPQTYITVKYKGKEREMRRFGECNLLDERGKIVKQIRPAEYLYVYRDGKKLSFSDRPDRVTKKKNPKKEEVNDGTKRADMGGKVSTIQV